MKLDSSRFNSFWSNPDKFRIREAWKLQPQEPKAGSFASLLSFGRRRGTAFHEFRDGAYRQVSEFQVIEDLKNGGFSEREIQVAKCMAVAASERYPDEKYLAHEVTFEYPIPDSPHFLVGRIDHIFERDGKVWVGDWKTSKYRPKRELDYKGDEYCKSTQVGFYLLGARTLGFDTRDFLYRLVHSERKDSRASIREYPTQRTTLELNQLARSVHQTCELILWMRDTFGIEKHWPVLPEKFTTGYESLLGKSLYPEYVPEGYQPKQEHLSIAEIL